MCGSRKYPWHPHRRDQIFLGEGLSIYLIFQWGAGVHYREIFPEDSHDVKECDKEKTKKFTTTIYLQR